MHVNSVCCLSVGLSRRSAISDEEEKKRGEGLTSCARTVRNTTDHENRMSIRREFGRMLTIPRSSGRLTELFRGGQRGSWVGCRRRQHEQFKQFPMGGRAMNLRIADFVS